MSDLPSPVAWPASMGASAESDSLGDTPGGWYQRMQLEFQGARDEVKTWHVRGKNILKRFRDDRSDDQDADKKWNLFSANIQTQRAMLYGNTPKVDVTRKWADANDDVARVASEMLERLLNCDIARDTDGYRDSLGYALDDRLMPGMGVVRLRYVVEFETRSTDAVTHPETGEELEPAEEYEAKAPGTEDVEVDYIHWRDVLWSSGARTFSEVRWWAFRAQMTKRQLIERFGEEEGKQIPLNSKRPSTNDEGRRASPWERADVWEVWHKESGKVLWFVEGMQHVLDLKDDPLGLEGFWPFALPMIANRTNDTLVPVPDFYLAQDLYNEVDEVTSRIAVIVRALRVAGVYDKTAQGLERLVNETRQNELIPIENWALFAEKGGVRGQIDWLPYEQVAIVLDKLRDYRQEIVTALYQITGFSDIMRGESAQVGVTATEQGIKARFASVRMQALQDEFARFASDIQRIKAEIISKHFEPETIIMRSNIQYTDDAQLAMQAVQLLKSPRFAHYRVEVKPEAVNMTDFAALKAERTEFMAALSGFFTAMAPIGQSMPGSVPYLLEMCKWFVAGMKGSSTIEATLDRAIEAAKLAQQQAAANPQQAPPDPKIQAAQLKMQGDQMRAQTDMVKEKAKVQGDLIRIRAETQAKDEQERSQAMWNTWEASKKHALLKQPGATSTPGVNGGVT